MQSTDLIKKWNQDAIALTRIPSPESALTEMQQTWKSGVTSNAKIVPRRNPLKERHPRSHRSWVPGIGRGDA